MLMRNQLIELLEISKDLKFKEITPHIKILNIK